MLLSFAACDAPAPSSEATSEAAQDAPLAARPEGPKLPTELAADHPVLSPNARIGVYDMLVEDRDRARSPGDGGGRMWIERVVGVGPNGAGDDWSADGDPTRRPSLTADAVVRFEMVYEVGEHGIVEGGRIFVQPEPFWGWSVTQTHAPDAPGYTTATPREPGVTLEPEGEIAAFLVAERALEPGERIDVVYGAGPAGARVDRYAQHGAEILAGSDADGDGYRVWSKRRPLVDIRAHDAVRILALGPGEVAPGERFEIQVAALDAVGNHAAWPTGLTRLEIRPDPASTTGAETLSARTVDVTEGRSFHRVELEAPATPGTLRLEVRGDASGDGYSSRVNPIVVRESEMQLFWADLHGHSGFSDGTGTPDDYFHYARDVARLDAIALTDHDHWGIWPLDESPDLQADIERSTAAYHEPGRFVTIPGYEWTNWLHGHRHVLYFDEDSHATPIHSALDPATDRPDELWAALTGQPALTFAHHSAGDPVATNWFYRPDPILEPITEIVSIHGMSEAADSPVPVDGAIPGNFVRDTLMQGVRFGFIGSGDSHDGHPGLAQLAAPTSQGGLAGIFAQRLDRASLLEALRARRTFATNGIRAWLDVRIDDTPMGGMLPESMADEGSSGATKEATQRLSVRFVASAPIERIDLVRSGVVASLDGQGALDLDLERAIPALGPGEFHYVRILQSDGGVAWSSPIVAQSRPLPRATNEQ